MLKPASQLFISHLREILQEPWEKANLGHFLHLSKTPEVTPENLLADKNSIPPSDPLTDACQTIIQQARELSLANTLNGINEIYKEYLRQVTLESQCSLTKSLTENLELVFLYIISDNFPYSQKTWEWISASAKPVALYLLKNDLPQAAAMYLEFLSRSGKLAAKKNLRTGTLQHVFRILELRTGDLNWKELTLKIKNLRQNLES
ncbi:MAG: hypothetical protein PHT78_08755 [Desulfitobacteriaceae bacterium]|nr:hypothetical protein [Desulfitobacteriaceae bacterium]MDD4753319.1 hypothetical protein [Desulfitobacteriaceae bacterium]